MAIPLGLYGAIVLALLIAELREDRRAQYFFKPLAALGFVLLALMCGSLETVYGRWMLAGLVICAFGDVLLLPRKSEMLFKFGMVAFAMGHLAYALAFSIDRYPLIYFGGREIIALLFWLATAVFYLWLKPNLQKPMAMPVALYSIIIALMMTMSLRIIIYSGSWLIFVPLAAIMFAVSDMFVARDRFVTSDPKNALAISPLYFGAQALFALSVQM